MKSEIKNITPEMALSYLEGPMHNRPVRDATVDRYAATMAAKKWLLTHQGIAFDDKGRLIDGQHRLWAIVNSKMTVPMMVTHGLSSGIQAVIDDHAKRTVRDVAILTSGMQNINTRHISAARIMATHGLGYQPKMLTNQIVIELVKKWSEGLHFILSECFKNTGVRGITQGGVIAVATQAYYAGANQDRLREFGEVMVRGISIRQADVPAMILRNWLLQQGSRNLQGPVNQKIVYAKTQRALYAFLERIVVTKLYEAKEQLFPLPGSTKPARKQPYTIHALARRLAAEKAEHAT